MLRPFDQADALAVEIVLIANLIHLVHIAETIYIKMVGGRRPSSYSCDREKSGC